MGPTTNSKNIKVYKQAPIVVRSLTPQHSATCFHHRHRSSYNINIDLSHFSRVTVSHKLLNSERERGSLCVCLFVRVRGLIEGLNRFSSSRKCPTVKPLMTLRSLLNPLRWRPKSPPLLSPPSLRKIQERSQESKILFLRTLVFFFFAREFSLECFCCLANEKKN